MAQVIVKMHETQPPGTAYVFSGGALPLDSRGRQDSVWLSNNKVVKPGNYRQSSASMGT